MQTLVILIFHAYSPHPIFPDAQSYDAVGKSIADSWRASGGPEAASASRISGTATYGIYGLFAVIYYYLGHSWLAVKLAFGLVAATGPVALYLVATRLLPRRTAQRVAYAAALYPTSLIWSAVGLKDGLVGALAIDLLAVIILVKGKRQIVLVVLGCGLMALARPTVSVALGVALVIRIQWWRISKIPALAFAGALPLVAIVPTARILLARSSSVRAGQLDDPILNGGLLSRALHTMTPSNLVRGALGPFPWSWATPSPYRLLYPGTTIWILLLPFVGIGLWLCWHRGLAEGRGVAAFVLAYMLCYYILFGSDAFRQRTIIEPLGLLLASMAAQSMNNESAIAVFGAWCCILCSGVLVQARLISIPVMLLTGATGFCIILMRRIRLAQGGARHAWK